jgi:rhodanese-related sulfurtransferase
MSSAARRTAVPLDPATLAERLHELEVVDVRTPGEFEAAHLAGAHNVPLDRLERRIDEIRDLVGSGREVVLLCRTDNRSRQAQARLEAAGLPPLPVVVGGMQAWQAQGRPVVQEHLRWDLERQVRLVAGLLVLSSILASLVWPSARFLAGAIGAGLVIAALTNTCTMGLLLARLPYNRPNTG